MNYQKHGFLGTLSLCLLLQNNVQAQILPENDLDQEDTGIQLLTEDLSEGRFNELIDVAIRRFETLAELHGGKLTAKKLWASPTVNASALRDGNNWTITMYGGLSRRSEVSEDSFTLVICHELGHLLAGYPFKEISSRTAASEGQSDYYATHVCAPELWKDEVALNEKAAQTVSAAAKVECDSAWKETADRNVCYRSANAAEGLALLLARVKRIDVPKFDSPSATIATETLYNKYPEPQCRIDTMLHGALCNIDFDLKVIPGEKTAEGKNSLAAEEDAASHSCTLSKNQLKGSRPACWYKDRLVKEEKKELAAASR